MGSRKGGRGVHVGVVFGSVNFWADQSSQMASDCDVRDLLQDHLARHRGIPTVVNKSTRRVTGRRNDVCIYMGCSADHCDALGLCVQDLCFAVEEKQVMNHEQQNKREAPS
jgi:hypothetical protein